MNQLLEKIVEILSPLPFLEGIVLGGSHATGTANEASDVDIGLYYRSQSLNPAQLCAAAVQLDDGHRKDLICAPGGWGPWVDCGGWLTIDGVPVDLILRDWARVKNIVSQSEEGRFSCHYQPGHPHAYLDVMYRGELAASRVLFVRGTEFPLLKAQAEHYPLPLQKALISHFSFEADFSLLLAQKHQDSGDTSYVMGHLYRCICALNQILFALNQIYCLNEKKAVHRAAALPLSPPLYEEQVNEAFATSSEPLSKRICILKSLWEQIKILKEE